MVFRAAFSLLLLYDKNVRELPEFHIFLKDFNDFIETGLDHAKLKRQMNDLFLNVRLLDSVSAAAARRASRRASAAPRQK